MLRPRTTADLERAREEVEWLDDDDLREVESKSRLGALLLGLFTWGGGRIYLGDYLRGGAGVAALIAAAALLPAAIGPIVYMTLGAGAAAWSFHGARQVNRFVAVRDELQLRAGPDPSAYRLLTAAAAVDPTLAPAVPQIALPQPLTGPHAAVVDRLRKLAALRRAGVINETELQDRKVDILNEVAPANTADLDDLLFALLPLGNEGVLTPDDFELLKQLGGDR